MTEKRFQIIHLGNPYDFVVKDHATNKTYGTLQGDDKSLTELLNELHEEIQALKLELELSKPLFSRRELETKLKEQHEENEQLRNDIKEAYNNERTMIGKSVLKQLMETIQ